MHTKISSLFKTDFITCSCCDLKDLFPNISRFILDSSCVSAGGFLELEERRRDGNGLLCNEDDGESGGIGNKDINYFSDFRDYC